MSRKRKINIAKQNEIKKVQAEIIEDGTPWTVFWDMHSGGGSKEEWDKIYIQAPSDEARIIFYNRFGHSPDRVSCTCCGEDYSVSEEPTLAEASAYHRNCKYEYSADRKSGKYVEKQNEDLRKYVDGAQREETWQAYLKSRPEIQHLTVEQYAAQDSVLVITKQQITDQERQGEVPQQGYVWMD